MLPAVRPHLGPSIKTPSEELSAILTAGSRVLDVGAGAHKPSEGLLLPPVRLTFLWTRTHRGDFDFRSFSDVPESTHFDAVMANQILEHVSVDEAFSIVASAYKHLSSGGCFIATVPNAAHPVSKGIAPTSRLGLLTICIVCCAARGFEVTTMARYNKFPLTSNPIKRWIRANRVQ